MNDEQSHSQASLTCRNTSEGRGENNWEHRRGGWGKAMQGGARTERTHAMETKTKGGLVLQEGLGFCSQGGRGGGTTKIGWRGRQGVDDKRGGRGQQKSGEGEERKGDRKNQSRGKKMCCPLEGMWRVAQGVKEWS